LENESRGFCGILRALDFSPDGTTVLSGTSEQTIVQWRLDNPTLDELMAWIEENRYVGELTFEKRAMYQIKPLCNDD
jgi:WD40 repeat protein